MANEITGRLRAAVAHRANRCCEYCLIHEDDAGFPHQIDHIVSRKHGGDSHLDNLAYACVVCNRNKGSDVASFDHEIGSVVRLFNPRQDRWADHFLLRDERIEPLTDVGRATARTLQLNAVERLAERTILLSLGVFPPRSLRDTQ